MKIAVPVINDQLIHDHFGQSEMYNVYSVTGEGNILGKETVSAGEGCGCRSGIAGTLHRMGVKAILVGGIGGGAIQVLNHHDIEVIRGCSGDPESAVKRFISGELTDSGDTCSHHGEHHQGDHSFRHQDHHGGPN